MYQSLLRLCPEIRLIVYTHLFRQPDNEILALSREPEHDYSNGPPSDWIADSRQEGLVYNTDAARAEPTNAGFLRTCRTINNEATPIFYGQNRIKVYAEDNNDIFYWLLDIGEHNRRAIRDIDIDFAYGVCIASGRGNIHGLMETIDGMEDSEVDEVQKKRQQLISIVQRLELKTVRLSQCPFPTMSRVWLYLLSPISLVGRGASVEHGQEVTPVPEAAFRLLPFQRLTDLVH